MRNMSSVLGKQAGSVFATVLAATATAAGMTAYMLYYLSSPQTKPISQITQEAREFLVHSLKSLLIRIGGVEKRLLVLLPDEKTTTEDKLTLLIIFPGAFMEPGDYEGIAKVVQDKAAPSKIIVAIGISVLSCSRLVRWALDNNNNNSPGVVTQMIQKQATILMQKQLNANKQQPTIQMHGEMKDLHETNGEIFENIFIWGHSAGGWEAMKAALPSTTSGLILYGCSMSFSGTLQANPWPDFIQNNLLSSYPRPVLTVVGERDGFMRWHTVAGEAHTLHKDSQRRIKSCTAHATVQQQLQRTDELRKPVVILPDLNHMHMATGRVSERALQTGRKDFPSRIENLSEAHETLAHVVVDFMTTHSKTAPDRQKAEKKLLRQHERTESLFLGPFSRLSDRVCVSQFVNQIQRRLLHLTARDEIHNFYDESDHDREEDNPIDVLNGRDKKELVTVVTNWHQEPKDFLYSKSSWLPKSNLLFLEATEQDPIAISRVAQMSKTLAFKGKTQEYILQRTTKYQTIKDSPAPTLMQLNKQTFDEVLNTVVTSQQRQRYKKEGKELRFGPDIFVSPAPKWVETPLSLTLYPPPDKQRENEESYYLLQSPYVTTAHMDIPEPFAGAWYGKPLSPAQAYEWIVFDAFK